MDGVDNASEHDHAHVLVMPPLLYLGAIVVGLALGWLVGGDLALPSGVRWPLGIALVGGGIAGALAFSRAFERAGQDRNPNTPTPGIISTGLYRFSRNPAYVCLTAIQAGIAVLLDSAWILFLLVPVLVVMHFGVIRREEAYLERKFGDDYARYRERVRRWL